MAFTFNTCRNRKGKTNQDDREQSDEDGDSCRRLAFKSGFVSLQDRLRSLSNLDKNVTNQSGSRRHVEQGVRQAPQFATLQELFSNQSTLERSQERGLSSEFSQARKPKIPVMRLSKEDWNVKCWEERLSAHKARYAGYGGENKSRKLINPIDSKFLESNRRSNKPGTQIEVFKGRIDDVASKLEKVREGVPQDEKLYKLSLNKRAESKNSHEWTDMLKEELQKGVHNPRVLQSKVKSIGSNRDTTSTSATAMVHNINKLYLKSETT